jgi:hypothetical protein
MNRSPFHRVTLGLLLACSADTQTAGEYELKSAVIGNLAKFVEWPSRALSGDKDPFQVCVLGKDPFHGALESALNGKLAMGRPFAILAVADASKTSGCQILFIVSPDRKRLHAILSELRPEGILTVGESEGFAAQGGMVDLILEDGHIRMRINLEAATQAHLKVSSKLLGLAEIVKGKDSK